MGLFPKMLGGFQRIDFESFPPRDLIAGLMQLPVMASAERDGEFVADFKAEGSRLSKPQMMRIARLPTADQTRLRGDKFQVSLVAQSLGFGDDKLALVDFGWKRIGYCGRQGRGFCSIFLCLCQIRSKERIHRVLVPPPIVMRWPRDRRHIVRVKTDAWLYRWTCSHRCDTCRVMQGRELVLAVERKPKRPAEGR